MGKTWSFLTRPIRDFNIENRAMKLISSEKPKPAPQHPDVEKQRKIVQELNPKIMEELLKKDSELDDRLKKVYVVSQDPQVPKDKKSESSRPLPKLRRLTPSFEYGVYEPPVLPEGKSTLRHVMTFLTKHNEDPVKNNSDSISKEYKLDQKVVEDILRHYKIHRIVLPSEEEEKADPTFAEGIKKLKQHQNKLNLPQWLTSRDKDVRK